MSTIGNQRRLRLAIEGRPRDLAGQVGRREGTPKKKDRAGARQGRVPARRRKKKRG